MNDTTNTTPEVEPEEVKVSKAKTKAKQPAPDGNELLRVIIQRPFGVKDSHLFIGFNDFEGQFAYEKPIKLPRKVVNHLRSIERVEYSADEAGNPIASFSRMYAVLDAPEASEE